MNRELHGRVKQIFLQAVELDPAQRRSFLDQATANDRRLRREVESLLKHHSDRTILPQSADVHPPSGGDDATDDNSTRRIGRRLVGASGEIFRQLFGDRRRRLLAVACAALALMIVGAAVYHVVHRAMRKNIEHDLVTILRAEVEALDVWFQMQRRVTRAIANDTSIREHTSRLIEIVEREQPVSEKLLESAELDELRREIRPILDAHDYEGFAIVNRARRIVAAAIDPLVGDSDLAKDVAELDEVFGPNPQEYVTLPFASSRELPDVDGQLRIGVPTMMAMAPIRDSDSKVVAALGLRINPQKGFTRILRIARSGDSGETYAFDQQGVMLSESRFDQQLRDANLIRQDDPHARSTLNVEIRDPGVDLTRGQSQRNSRGELPLTRAVRTAVEDRDEGVDADGYRDYRGIEVVGAWNWLDRYQFGVVTEIDRNEAYAPLRILDVAFAALFVVLVGAVTMALVSSFWVVRLQREVGKARQLGQYTLEEQIGEGGMGRVYLARHALLKRPTAVKVLKTDQANRQTIARFQREVQLASQLTHPNTIEIYDFGHSDDGIFFYAMEYLTGITLSELIEQEAAVPPARVAYILKQVCYSLEEAHAVGLIHRDIKTQNIMLCERGLQFDYVKVLDFGLVKYVDSNDEPQITQEFQISGTPLYMAPEQIRNPRDIDASVDVYALGVVGFNLLTGRNVFEAAEMMQLLHQVLNKPAPRPSACTSQEIPTSLDDLIFHCLAKQPADRPPSVASFRQVLESEDSIPPWTQSDSRRWWQGRKMTR